jgi:tetratricopeptide (TPR) repeat protein
MLISTMNKSTGAWGRVLLTTLVVGVGFTAAWAQGPTNTAKGKPPAGQATAQSQTPDVPSLISDGQFYLTHGDCALAQYFFQEALKTEATNADALLGKGQSLTCQQAYPQAVDAYQAALKSNPKMVLAYVHLALTYRDEYQSDAKTYPNRLSDALDTIQKAEAFAPNDPRVLNTKGVVLYDLGSFDKARTALENAVSQSTSGNVLSAAEQSTLQVNLGRVYRAQGDLKLAEQAFRRAVVLDPTNSSAHNNLGNVAYQLKDCSTAEYELSQAASLDPQSLSAVSQLGITMFECGDVKASVPKLEAALKLNGAVFVPPLYTYLARAYIQTGQVDEAVKRAQQGALLPPESADAYYWLGKAYQARGASGDVANAKQAYQHALQIDPNYQPAKQALNALQ